MGAGQERPGRTWEGFGRGCRPESVRDGLQGVTGMRLKAYQAQAVRAPCRDRGNGQGIGDWVVGLRRRTPSPAAAGAFSLHAATRIDADDRAGLERLARYVTRPPLAAGRLQIVDDERPTFRLKTPWSDGTTHLLLSPLELIEKLASWPPTPAVCTAQLSADRGGEPLRIGGAD